MPPVVDLGDRATTTLGSLAFIGPSWTSADGLPAPEVVCASHDVPQSLAEETAVLLCKSAITCLPSDLAGASLHLVQFHR